MPLPMAASTTIRRSWRGCSAATTPPSKARPHARRPPALGGAALSRQQRGRAGRGAGHVHPRLQGIHTFEARAQLHTWLHRILVNTALMKLRERRRRPHGVDRGSAAGVRRRRTPGRRVTRLERRGARAQGDGAVVREAIARLPDQYREVLVLRDIEEKDTAEAAESSAPRPMW